MKCDFSKTKLRCHYLGDICQSEGKGGGLSAVAKKKLVEVYWDEKYGKKKVIKSKYFTKGILVEDKVIELISFLLDLHFQKNEERIENEYLSGIPDIFLGENILRSKKVWDSKASWDAASFGVNILDTLNPDYEWQGHGYMGLTGAEEFATCYGLVTAPEMMIKDEQRKLLYSPENNWVTEENPEYLEAAAGVELNMTFDDIAMEERLLIFPVKRDMNKILRIYQKVEESRLFLAWYQDKHLTFNTSYFFPKATVILT